jgi:ABC-type multidrug transport system ATPase subunit
MKAHAKAGNIVFFSSHIIEVVEKICDRVAIIKKGRIRACTSIAELEERGIGLEDFYLSIINAEEEPVTEGDGNDTPMTETAFEGEATAPEATPETVEAT